MNKTRQIKIVFATIVAYFASFANSGSKHRRLAGGLRMVNGTVRPMRFVRCNAGKVSLLAIIGLALGIFVAAAILPDAIISITNSTPYTDAGTVPAAVITLMTTVAGIVIAAIFLIMLYKQATD